MRRKSTIGSLRSWRSRFLVAAVGVLALVFLALPVAQAEAEDGWWELNTSSRPTYLWTAPKDTMVQELTTAKSSSAFGDLLAARVEVGGQTVACLGIAGLSSTRCTAETGKPGISTAADLQSALEGPYGSGGVQVTGGPAGSAPLVVSTPGRWDLPVELTPLILSGGSGPTVMGSAEAKVTSEGSGSLVITATNLGGGTIDATSTPLTVTDELPEGFVAYGVEGLAGAQDSSGPVACELASVRMVSCRYEGELPAYESLEIEILAAVEGDPLAIDSDGEVSIAGADAKSVSSTQSFTFSTDPVPFGLEDFSTRAEASDGAPVSSAGDLPYQVTNTFVFNSGRQQGSRATQDVVIDQPALPRNTGVTFPAGLVGSATSVPTCPLEVFSRVLRLVNRCGSQSAVGVAAVTVSEPLNLSLTRLAVPIFNLPPEHGEPARFGFVAVGTSILIDTAVDPDNGYRITGAVRNASQIAEVISASVSLWGEPGNPSHDSARGWACLYYVADDPDVKEVVGDCTPPTERATRPFLRVPTTCTDPLAYEGFVEPWNTPPGSAVQRFTASSGGALSGCSQVPFAPEIGATMTSKLAGNPSGLDFELEMKNPWPNNVNQNYSEPGPRAEAQAKKVEVTLPEGVTVNPAQADGLAVCTEADLKRERYDSAPGEGCPEASKIGSIRGSTPLLDEPYEGSLYVAEPYNNPFNTLIALYLVARIPERGILIKQAGKVEPNSRTGQLVTTFDNLPQVPFSDFKLHFREGGRSALITPPHCGSFQTLARFVPWSADDPNHPRPDEIVEKTATFTVERGVDGGACPPGGAPPFEPGFSGGTLNNAAAAYSPFQLRLQRRDGDQDLVRFDATLPPGALAKLAGVGRCSDAQIAQIKTRTGKQELASPSCPASSKIGSVWAGAGVGSQLIYVPGSVYLAGPFGGAPLSVVGVVPAVAGPFDVGVVATRQALTVDPITGIAKVDGRLSEPIPHILAGIPLKVRDIQVSVDRPEFTLNPTSCDPLSFGAEIWGGGADPFSLADDSPVARGARFQAADCASLGFKPRLNLQLKGATRRGGFPALRGTFVPRPGDANLKGLTLRLPHSAFLEQSHIRTICTRVQFAARSCPRGAIYGHARAFTPLLDEPLEGPVYLRSSSNPLPDFVADLHGLVDIEAVARIDSKNGGIRATFLDTPDAPLTKVVVDMQGGRKGLIVNSTDLCAHPQRANASFTGHNGRRHQIRPKVVAMGCKKKAKAKRSAHKR